MNSENPTKREDRIAGSLRSFEQECNRDKGLRKMETWYSTRPSSNNPPSEDDKAQANTEEDDEMFKLNL
tara:strand:- start:216 stop:422 length:207 start_codon:yes stop_codon:yes gene_type:complete